MAFHPDSVRLEELDAKRRDDDLFAVGVMLYELLCEDWGQSRSSARDP
jgi:hypothetical protein